MPASKLPSRRARAPRRLSLAAGLIGLAAVGVSFGAELRTSLRGLFDDAGGAVMNALPVRPAPLEKRAEERPASSAPAPAVKRGRNSVPNGVMLVPESFVPSAEGEFDLIVHFHGNTNLALESYERLGFNAVFAALNLGTGSRVYEESFGGPNGMETMLGRIPAELQKRGVARPRLRRLALVAWSAGYAAVVQVLAQPRFAEKVDAAIFLDGLHVPFRRNKLEPNREELGPLEPFARRALAGERLFVVTHSNVEAIGYASVTQTTDLLLDALRLERAPASGETAIPDLAAVKGVLPRDELVALVPTTKVDAGGFHVRTYRGNQPTHHISHLLQMSEIALPLLAERWRAE